MSPTQESLRVARTIFEQFLQTADLGPEGGGYYSDDEDELISMYALALDQVALASGPTERCKHDVHGTDCYECYPPKPTLSDEPSCGVDITQAADKAYPDSSEQHFWCRFAFIAGARFARGGE